MNSSLQRLTAIAVAISVAACSIIDPIVMKEPKLDIDDTQPQFKAESAIALGLYDDYRKGRRDMGRYSFFTGLALTGLGLAGLGVALFQAPNNALFGVSFAAAGVAGVRAFVPFDARRQIYAGGQKAIVCSVSALSLGAVQAQPEPDPGDAKNLSVVEEPDYERKLEILIQGLESTISERGEAQEPSMHALVEVANVDTAVAFRAGALKNSATVFWKG